MGYCHSPDMMLLLAQAHNVPMLYGNKWPEAGLPPIVLQGIKVWVKPFVRTPGRKSSAHRVMCECPSCGKVMSAGRLFQHVCKKVAA
jgi:hypothetical protein